MGITPRYNEVDTCAAEFPSLTPYLYSSIGNFEYINNSSSSLDSHQSNPRKKVMIIGGGPNRIGQGIEFDYCCVHSSFALADLNVQSIMYNCNPETVSTDYDTSDVLYFEPIDFEHVRAVISKEKPDGIIVHLGGQTPLKLAHSLTKINAHIIGTSAKVIDIAEDREKFAQFVNDLGLKQPQNGIAFEKEQAYLVAHKIGFPVLVRPSYVLGGRAMRIVYDDDELKNYMDEVIAVSDSSPVLIDKFLEYAIELDVDCISDGKSVYIGGIMEHIEEAGIHSGDSASSLPSINISKILIDEIEQTTAKIALKLGVVGLMNVQYAIYNENLYLIEVNPRASRTVPFVSKATGIPLAKVATRVMWNHFVYHTSHNADSVQNSSILTQNAQQDILYEALCFYDKYNKIDFTSHIFKPKALHYVCLKESVFPFNKLVGAELSLGPEMKSTGEVMGIGKSFGLSFAKSQLACKNTLPTQGEIFLSLANIDKKEGIILARGFIELGFSICATEGTYRILRENNIEATHILKVSEGRPNIIDSMTNNQISLAINTSDHHSHKEDTHLIRTQIIKNSIPYFTTLSAARVAIEAIKEMQNSNMNEAYALQDYLQN